MDKEAKGRFGRTSLADARLELDTALMFDRAATRALQLAEARLNAAQLAFNTWVQHSGMSNEVRMVTAEVESATRTRLVAVAYHARSRDQLAKALVQFDTALGAIDFYGFGDTHDELRGKFLSARVDIVGLRTSAELVSASAAAAVVAEAAAIAAAAEARLAAEVQARTVEAAQIAEDAVAAAAATVAEAAEAARVARVVADTLAAQDVAVMARATAAGVQVRADELAAATSAAAIKASVDVSRTARPRDPEAMQTARLVAARVTAAAVSKADETASAAKIVAEAVAVAAAAVAALTEAIALATQREVVDAATAVQAIADATAREVAVATERDAVTARLAADARRAISAGRR